MTITFNPLSPALGAEVTGIDLRDELDPDSVTTIRDGWYRYQVLCFPGQKITPSDQIRFCNLFGKANGEFRKPRGNSPDRSKTAGVMLVSNIRKDGVPIGSLPDGDMQFHSDGAHKDVPYMATSLFAIKVPSKGGETLFADMYAPFDALAAEMQDRLRGLRAHFIYQIDSTYREGAGGGINEATHAMVQRHPGTGREALYLNRLMTRWIEGMGRVESDALLDELLELIERPEYVYAHRWKPGDLLLWDNRCVNHGRADFAETETRLLRRYTISPA